MVNSPETNVVMYRTTSGHLFPLAFTTCKCTAQSYALHEVERRFQTTTEGISDLAG